MKRIVLFVMTTLTILVLIFGYHTSTSSRAAGGGTAFVSTAPTTTAGTSLAPTTTLAEPSAAPTSAATTSAATTSAATTSAATTRTSSSSASTTTPATASSKTSAAPATTGSTAAKATTSTITGSVADTRWGPVQVQVTVVSGKITSVAVLQYPNGNGRDQEINATALPILVQETLTAQGANIDMVSGATVTSGGYLTSLQSALDQM